MTDVLSEFEERIHVSFKNRDLLTEAVTHRSYINENTSWELPHNERLEFLGDAVLELVVTEELFAMFPEEPEGQLTSIRSALVNHVILSKIAKDIGLEACLKLSRGEARDVGKARDVILANAIEAVIGAMYLDVGYEISRTFIHDFVMNHVSEVVKQGLHRDPKSLLQEIIQEERKVTPTYRVLDEHGPDHQKRFLVGVYFGEEEVAQGTGTSKQEAERQAAQMALQVVEKKRRG